VDTDEGVRADTTTEGLSKLKPAFEMNGSITAGNSSQTSDGAAFVLVVSESLVKSLQLQPIARLVSSAVAGVPPRSMGIGPVEAIPKALKQSGMSLGQIDLIELNEAFASQALAVIRKAELNPDIVNINGGAIALGQPLGMSGTRILYSAALELQHTNKRYALVTMCIGVGQGYAVIIERC